MSTTPEDVFMLLDAALESERVLFEHVTLVDDHAEGKALLVKPKTLDAPSPVPLRLEAIASDADWAAYLQARYEVEKVYGLNLEQTERIIQQMQQRMQRMALGWHFLWLDEEAVGAVGLLLFEHQGQHYGRLQDVDVFPGYRGQGNGNRLLTAVEALAWQRRAAALFIGADTDDWPLGWYQRRGYTRIGTVIKVVESSLG